MNRSDMGGFEKYQIRRLPKFETSLEQLIKKHYRKDKKARREFEEFIDSYIEELEKNPFSDRLSDKEPFPSDTSDPDLEFRKKRWTRLPRLKGSARFGRLLFVIARPTNTVYLIWIYTHSEYQSPKPRPPDKELKDQIKQVKKELALDKSILSDKPASDAYDSIRQADDVKEIARNTGWPEYRIQRIKHHLFYKEHKFDNAVSRLDPNRDIAYAWERLRKGQHEKEDLRLLESKYFESRFECIFCTDFRTAREATIRSGRI